MSEEKAEQVQDSNVDSVADSAKEEATVTESEENVVVDNLTDDELDKRIQRANKEAAKFRVEKNEVEGKYDDLIQNLGKALGFVEEDNANNADALADEVQKLQDENKNLKLMQAFNNVVTTEGADDELTWSYLMAKGELTEMDANDPELKAKLSEKIKAAIEVKPVLKSDLPPTVKKSGSDMSNESQPLDTESRIRQLEADKNFKEARLLKSSRLYEMTKEQQ
jgi:hypothetical protein|tara:strand:- start:70 stop:738 length:669 start_codon:yes stop_codon:yes gene_type:complete